MAGPVSPVAPDGGAGGPVTPAGRGRGRGASPVSLRGRGRGGGRGASSVSLGGGTPGRGGGPVTPAQTQGRGRGRGRGGRGGHAAGVGVAGGVGAGVAGVVGAGGAGIVLRTVDGPWVKENPTGFSFSYRKTPGPTSPSVTSASTATDLFARFFSQDVWDLLVEETNRYAATVVETTPRARKWEDTTVREMKAFVGVLMFMGCLRHPRLEMYWAKKYPELETPGISAIMPIRRFQQLFRCFHLCDNTKQIPFGQPGHDKLFKVRPLLDILVAHFISEYEMHQQCSIDEAMIQKQCTC